MCPWLPLISACRAGESVSAGAGGLDGIISMCVGVARTTVTVPRSIDCGPRNSIVWQCLLCRSDFDTFAVPRDLRGISTRDVPNLDDPEGKRPRSQSSSNRMSRSERQRLSPSARNQFSLDKIVEWKMVQNDTLRSIAPVEADTLGDEVLEKVGTKLPLRATDALSEENAHEYVAMLLDAIRETAQDHRLGPHKPFHEYENTSQGQRPDFVITREEDHQPGPFANLFYIEAKSKEDLLREGVAQCVQRILDQFRLSPILHFGLAVVTDLRSFFFLRVGFETRKTREGKVLFARARVEVSYRHNLGDALDGLIRLMCDHDFTHYGLPASMGLPMEVENLYRDVGFLGSGGFADVRRVVEPQGQEYFACKITRDPAKLDHLTREAEALLKLEGVERVPKYVKLIRSDRETPVALITKPVGAPLKDTVDRAERGNGRCDLALDIFDSVSETLLAAHARSVAHGDVRPRNIIVVTRTDGPSEFFLIDWGLSTARVGIPTEKSFAPAGHATGDAKRPPKEHKFDVDFQQLASSCIEVAFSVNCGRLPWYGVQSDRSALDNINMRNRWFREHWDDLMMFARGRVLLQMALRQTFLNDQHAIDQAANPSEGWRWPRVTRSEIEVVHGKLKDHGLELVPQYPGDGNLLRSLLAADSNAEANETTTEEFLRGQAAREDNRSSSTGGENIVVPDADWRLIAAYADAHNCTVLVRQLLQWDRPLEIRPKDGAPDREILLYYNSQGHYDAFRPASNEEGVEGLEFSLRFPPRRPKRPREAQSPVMDNAVDDDDDDGGGGGEDLEDLGTGSADSPHRKKRRTGERESC